jgi:hypothetical protein
MAIHIKNFTIHELPKYIYKLDKNYYNIETCIINNGHTTRYFKPQRGVGQGCPISPYLFILTTELLNRWLKTKIGKSGIIDKHKNNYFVAQFADDTSSAITNEKDNMHQLFNLLQEYGIISGLKLNINKTEILLLGSAIEKNIPNRYQKHIKTEIKYLGCKITNDQKETTKINIKEAVEKKD